MILVVAYHVAQFGFQENEKTSAALPFLVLFRMPLFFFVSGFLAYKVRYEWNIGNALSMTWKKLKIQVIPALVFLCICITLKPKVQFWDELLVCMRSATKGGYWFTWVLLQMFVIYYTASVFGHYFKKGLKDTIWLTAIGWGSLWFLSVAAYETLYMPKVFTYHQDKFFDYTSLVQTIRFMQFFLLGNIVHRYWTQVQRLFKTAWFFPLIMMIAFVCCADIYKWHTMKLMWTNLPRTTAMYALLTLVVMFFHYYQQWFTTERFIGRSLQYIGQRTLDIYLLHFMLIPAIPPVGAWLNDNHPNFVLDIVLSASVALVVIGFCLVISNLLRISPFFRLYLFGRK